MLSQTGLSFTGETDIDKIDIGLFTNSYYYFNNSTVYISDDTCTEPKTEHE